MMVETVRATLSEHQSSESPGPLSESQRRENPLGFRETVGPAIFLFEKEAGNLWFFLPVFLLGAQEGPCFVRWRGRRRCPLAFLSSFFGYHACGPYSYPSCIRGRLIPESRNPFQEITQALFICQFYGSALRFRQTTCASMWFSDRQHFRSRFTSAADSCRPSVKALLATSTALPGISLGRRRVAPGQTDHSHIPESRLSSVPSADPTARQTTLLSMYDPTVMLSRASMAAGDDLRKAPFTMAGETSSFRVSTLGHPVENRLAMELTGIKTPLVLRFRAES